MKKYLHTTLILLLFTCTVQLSAQQLIQFSHSARVQSFYNPAAMANGTDAEIIALYRSQWTGIAGNPETQFLSAAYPLYTMNGALGLTLVNDVIGPQQDMVARLSFNRQFKWKQSRLILGANAGFIQKTLHGDQLITPTGNYEPGLINHNDVKLPAVKQQAGAVDFGVGMLFQLKELRISLAAQHLYSGKMNFEGGNAPFAIQAPPQLIAALSYRLKLNHSFGLNPFVQGKSDINTQQVDVGMELNYSDFLSFGLAWRGYNKYSADAVIAMLGLNATPGLYVGYSYDFTVSQLSAASSGTHEIILNYRIPVLVPSKGKIINNPRFLAF